MTRILELVRVEHHMSTAISLGAEGLDDAVADAFFAEVAALEDLLSRFRPHSEISRFASGALARDDLDPRVREVLARCESLRDLTDGDFEHEPRRRGDERAPTLDVNALAKGWIIEEAARVLRLHGAGFFVNAGGDIIATRRADGTPWRVGIQHPGERDAIFGVLTVSHGAVATSGAYERGEHIRRSGPAALRSVTVVGPDLGEADGLSTAVFAAGAVPPPWWSRVAGRYGLLTLDADDSFTWIPPIEGDEYAWELS
jgi:FAD:protein FMN transferase